MCFPLLLDDNVARFKVYGLGQAETIFTRWALANLNNEIVAPKMVEFARPSPTKHFPAVIWMRGVGIAGESAGICHRHGG